MHTSCLGARRKKSSNAQRHRTSRKGNPGTNISEKVQSKSGYANKTSIYKTKLGMTKGEL